MPDTETQYAVDLSDRREPTDADLKSGRERIKRKFWTVLDEVTDQVIDLALRAEKEDVRLKASSRILDEFSDRGKPTSTAPVSVQILNAIPLDRAAIIEGKEAQTVEWNGTTVALPKPIRKIGPDTSSTGGKTRDWVGGRIETGTESTVSFTPDPAEVAVPELPKRDPSLRK